MMVHTVFFWIKSGAPAGERDRVVQSCRELLGKIPVVRQIWVGVPAKTPKREVIDDSYAAGLTVAFDDLAAHDVYQEHPLHLQFVARHKEHWERVRVYDYQ